MEVVVKGIVLKSMPIGEYDRRLSILTYERGRISAFLKGAKRPKGSPLSSVEPFCTGSFTMYEGSNSYTIKSAEIKNHFRDLKADIKAVLYGSFLLDVSEYCSRENADERERLGLLYQSLVALTKEEFTKDFVRLVFLYKTIAINGEYPNIFECIRCKRSDNLIRFSIAERGCVCSDCLRPDEDLCYLSEAGRYTMDFIFRTPAKGLFSFKISDKIYEELWEILRLYRNRYFDHKFTTEDFLDL